MANMAVTYDEILSKAAELDQEKDNIDSQLKTLEAKVEQLTNDGYVTDKASVALNDHYTQFTQSATETIAHITEVTTLMRQSVDFLQNTDAEIARAAGGMG